MNKKGTVRNLKPFQQGETGNPNGRPKKLAGLDEILIDCMGDNGDEVKEIIKTLIKKAKQGDVRASEVLLDRCYGKVKQIIVDFEDDRKRVALLFPFE